MRELIGLCDEMLVHARSDDWKRVAEIDVHRGRLIAQYLGGPILRDDAALVQDAIRSMLAKNEELVALATTARDEAGKRAGQASKGRKALASYNAFPL
ncbi:MAG: flagellar protein FliT [Pseudomonadales bacterium]|nr:flagellar protein FliT [Pseudomonadales bacterium]